MFIDASAIVAIIGEEEAGSSLLRKIEQAEPPLYFSSIVVFDAVIALATISAIPISRSRNRPGAASRSGAQPATQSS